MKKPIEIPKSEARRIAIAHQGLHAAAPFGKGKQGVLEAVQQIGYVQIDTISVTERAHHHVLWSRVPGYHQKHLHDLQLKDRKVLEYWAHAAAYLPMEDFRFMLPIMTYFRDHHDPWPKADRKTMQWVMDRITKEGPLMSRHFEAPPDQTKTGWWDWKPAKIALQRLFFSGDLVISHREGFQRVYDLPDRVIPARVDTSPPTHAEYACYLIQRTIRAHGIARIPEMHYLRKGMGTEVKKQIGELLHGEMIREIRVRGVSGVFYSTEENLNRPLRVANSVRFLSPFDNVVIQRARLSDLFDFDYQIECYVPQPKRKYGYYCLPVLYGDRFVGRIDVKADRMEKVLHLVHVFFERKPAPRDYLRQFAIACRKFADFNQCGEIRIGRVTPVSERDVLQRTISAL